MKIKMSQEDFVKTSETIGNLCEKLNRIKKQSEKGDFIKTSAFDANDYKELSDEISKAPKGSSYKLKLEKRLTELKTKANKLRSEEKEQINALKGEISTFITNENLDELKKLRKEN